MRPLDIDNDTLVQECRTGDRDAMSFLYTRFAPRMLRVISRYVQDTDSAHDILHDGFIAAFTRLDSLREPEHLEFWLATIMKNLSLKYLQAQSVSSILDEIPETAEEPELDDIIDFDTLESLIRQLPEGYQKVFRLAVLENKSHKEISEILGIAPNSSSSQLFHAKIRLRELIKDYKIRSGLISGILFIASVGILLFMKPLVSPSKDFVSAEVTYEDSEIASAQSSKAVLTSAPVYSKKQSARTIKAHSTNIQSDPKESLSTRSTPVFSETDSVKEPSSTEQQYKQPEKTTEEEQDGFYERLFADIPNVGQSNKGWSAGISVDPGLMSFNSSSGDAMSNLPGNNTCQNPSGPSPTPDDDDYTAQSRVSRASTTDIKDYLASASRRHHLPISFVLTVERHFSSLIGVESGIGYSYLHTDFERSSTDVSTCHWHYLDIPLKINLYAYTYHSFKLYGSIGAQISLPVYSYAQVATNPYCESGRFQSKPVWSIGASVGVAYRLSKRFDVFIEPSLRYHFPQDPTIPNIWTDDQPWSFSLPIGFRLSW